MTQPNASSVSDLGHSPGLLELLFEQVPMGIGVVDRDFVIRRLNPTLAHFMATYSRTPREAIVPGAPFFALVPQTEPVLRPIFERVIAGETVRIDALALENDGIVSYWDAAFAPVSEGGAVSGVLGVVANATERTLAETELRRKQQEYRDVFEATGDALVIFDLETGNIVEANPAAGRLYGYSPEEFIGLPSRAIIHPSEHRYIDDFLRAARAGQTLRRRGVNVRKDGTPFHVDIRASAFTYEGKPRLLGVLRDITDEVQAYQRLEQRIEERTRELSGLLDISQAVASTLRLEPLLGSILDCLKVVVDYAGAAIMIRDHDDLLVVDARWEGGPDATQIGLRFPVARLGGWRLLAEMRGPAIVDDLREDTPLARLYWRITGAVADEEPYRSFRSWLGVPLIHKDNVIGMLALAAMTPDFYTARHGRLTMAFANQVATAIENARLYEQAQQLATLEERQRLARELHDSVTQTLFSMTLLGEALPQILDRDPERARERIARLNDLARGALAEMRALIFELRPESLEREGLTAALEKQAAALRSRHLLVVEVTLCPEPNLPLEMKDDLYRIAREALHNTVKHANATYVTLQLALTAGAIMLEVTDNGAGFDPSGDFPGHLGLRSMRERVGRLGGELRIESAPGRGTRVRAHIRV